MYSITIYEGNKIVDRKRMRFKSRNEAVEYANSLLKPGQTWVIR